MAKSVSASAETVSVLSRPVRLGRPDTTGEQRNRETPRPANAATPPGNRTLVCSESVP
jgi:hypothetical protein